MITYLYWALVISLVIAAFVIIGVKLDNRNAGITTAAVRLLVGWATYYFHFQQIFV